MALEYNADELFEIAEQIERNGANFYSRAADIAKKEEEKELLLTLASWEAQHEKLFAIMRQNLSEKDRENVLMDRDNQAAKYLQAVADTHIFSVHEASNILQGSEDMADILNIALDFEKDTIVFFLAMKELVPKSLGKDKVDGILSEEMHHVQIIAEHIKSLSV
jgi:rubrerythrin